MKNYGAMKATEFNKGNLAPLYKLAKNGELKVERWFMCKLYDLADFYGHDDNGTVEQMEQSILNLLAFESIDEMQERIDTLTERWFSEYSKKVSSKFNRNLVA